MRALHPNTHQPTEGETVTVEIIRDALGIIVRNEGEYGAFFVRAGLRMRSPSERQYLCELTIQSSFGNVGHFWTHMGEPADKFFASVEKSYLVGKLFGEHAYEFDSEATERALKKMLLRDRREREVDSDLAREIWNDIQDMGMYHHLEAFCDAYTEFPVMLEWTNVGDIPYQQRFTAQATGFWEKLWPEFVTALQQELNRPKVVK